MTLWLLFVVITMPVCMGCASSGNEKRTGKADSQAAQDTMPTYKALANEKYNSDVSYRYNSDRTAVLCVKQARPTSKQVFPNLKFFIYDLNSQKIIFEESLPNGKVVWLNDQQIRVTTVPGIVPGDEEAADSTPGYIYDIQLRKKTKNPAADVDR